MSVPSYRSYSVTLRPLDGVTDAQVTSITKWIRKVSVYYHVITEKTGSERHVHAGFILKEARPRSNVLQRLMQLFKDLSASEKSVFRSGLRIMYNWDFIDSYLSKDDDTVVIASCLPEERHIEGYFPPKADVSSASKKRKCSLYYHELEELWFQYNTPGCSVDTPSCRDFLFRMMYAERCLPVIRDDRQIIQVARHLCRWLNHSTHSTIVIPPFEQEE